MTNRTEWNETATKAISELVDAPVEVVLMKIKNGFLTISVYSEIEDARNKAVSHFEEAGATAGKSNYYEVDGDMPEAFQTEIYLAQ